MTRCFKRYRGVAIFRNVEVFPGADFDITEDGRTIPRRPRKGDKQITFSFVGGYPEDSVREVKQTIDELLSKAPDEALMVKTLNED